MFYEGMKDILLSFDQDLDFANGDLRLTSGVDLIKRKMQRYLTAEVGDWRLYNDVGASLSRFIGEPNTRATAEEIDGHLKRELNKIVYPATIQTKIIPMDLESVYINIQLFFLNSIIEEITCSFDYINGFVYSGFDDKTDTIISDSNIEFNEDGSTRKPNKYWDRIRTQ